MKVLLRDRGTGLFFRVTGQWTARRMEALDFESCPRAIERVVSLGLKNAEIVLDFGPARMDLTLPLANDAAMPPGKGEPPAARVQ